MDEKDLIRVGCTILGLSWIALCGLSAVETIGNHSEQKALKTQNKIIENEKEYLTQSVKDKFGFNELNLINSELSLGDGRYTVNFLGTADIENEQGIINNNYVKLSADIDEEYAADILSALNQYEKVSGGNGNGTSFNAYTSKIENNENFKFDSVGIKKLGNAYSEVLEVFNVAVQNSYNQLIEAAINSNSLENRLEKNTGIAAEDLKILNISDVTSEGNINYFTIETIVKNSKGKLENKTLKVEVEGENLTSDKVYLKYLAGKHSKVSFVNGLEKENSETGLTL